MYQGCEVVVDSAAGTMGKTDPRPVLSDSLFNAFSVTKIFSPLAILILVDQGMLNLTDKVADHWPEYAANVGNGLSDPSQMKCNFVRAGQRRHDY